MSDINPDIVKRVQWEPEHDNPGRMKAFDEIVTGPLESVHIERMHDGCYWMALYRSDAERQVVIFNKEGRLLIGRTENDT